MELYPECEAVYFQNSGKLFLTERVRNHSIPREDRFVFFAVNARFFNIQEIRIGVDAQRAANISHGSNRQFLTFVIAQRGAKYAADFINYACVSSRRMYEHSASAFGSVAVWLVDSLDLVIPQNVDISKTKKSYL